MSGFRKWLSRKLWQWSVRVWEDWHLVTVVDGQGATAATFGCYGQWTASWEKPYDITYSCDDQPIGEKT